MEEEHGHILQKPKLIQSTWSYEPINSLEQTTPKLSYFYYSYFNETDK